MPDDLIKQLLERVENKLDALNTKVDEFMHKSSEDITRLQEQTKEQQRQLDAAFNKCDHYAEALQTISTRVTIIESKNAGAKNLWGYIAGAAGLVAAVGALIWR